MTASPAAINLIKEFEGLRLDAYQCPAHVWTIGWGHTAGVREGMRITEEQAEAFLRSDIENVERGLPSVIHVPLTQGQHDALVSLCFNLRGGAERLASTAPHLVANINAGNVERAAHELLDICHANGEVLPGLQRRRMEEGGCSSGRGCKAIRERDAPSEPRP